MYYILKNKKPVQVNSVTLWAEQFEKSDRKVNDTFLDNEVHISTVFLGLDHSFGGGTPILFETMIFGGDNDGYQERYSNWDDARKGHIKAVKLCEND